MPIAADSNWNRFVSGLVFNPGFSHNITKRCTHWLARILSNYNIFASALASSWHFTSWAANMKSLFRFLSLQLGSELFPLPETRIWIRIDGKCQKQEFMQIFFDKFMELPPESSILPFELLSIERTCILYLFLFLAIHLFIAFKCSPKG